MKAGKLARRKRRLRWKKGEVRRAAEQAERTILEFDKLSLGGYQGPPGWLRATRTGIIPT